MSTAYTELKTLMHNLSLYKSIAGLLSWDQQTYLPPWGVSFRSLQTGRLAELAHGAFVSVQTKELLGRALRELPEGD